MRLPVLVGLLGFVTACNDAFLPLDNPCPGIEVDAERGQYTCDFDWEWAPQSGISDGPMLTFEMPDDLVSFAVFAQSDGDSTGLAWLAVDDSLWIDGSSFELDPPAWYTPPFFHYAALGNGFVAPMDGSFDPSGATFLDVAPGALDDLTGSSGTLEILLRVGDTTAPAAIDLNIVVVGDTQLFQDEVDAAIRVVDRIWGQNGGPSVGEVSLYTIDGDAILRYRDSNTLRRTPLPDDAPLGVTVFFIDDYAAADGTLGEAGGIPGPVGLSGVDGAGVIVAVTPHLRFDGTLDIDVMGGTLAHEVGHQLGLFHTTESDGSRTESLDTPECPPSADANGDGFFSAAECASFDAPNFMFWSAGPFVQEDCTADQAFVLARSPVGRAQ
jgi:hypothetical protein